MTDLDRTYSATIQQDVLAAIVNASIVEVDGVRHARLHVAEIVDALSIITVSLLASAPEAATPEGRKRMLRRQARQSDKRIEAFNAHVTVHGAPFHVEA